jgi:hypothetical protein
MTIRMLAHYAARLHTDRSHLGAAAPLSAHTFTPARVLPLPPLPLPLPPLPLPLPLLLLLLPVL